MFEQYMIDCWVCGGVGWVVLDRDSQIPRPICPGDRPDNTRECPACYGTGVRHGQPEDADEWQKALESF